MSSFAHTSHESGKEIGGLNPRSIKARNIDDNREVVESDADIENDFVVKVMRAMEAPPGDDLYKGDCDIESL